MDVIKQAWDFLITCAESIYEYKSSIYSKHWH